MLLSCAYIPLDPSHGKGPILTTLTTPNSQRRRGSDWPKWKIIKRKKLREDHELGIYELRAQNSEYNLLGHHHIYGNTSRRAVRGACPLLEALPVSGALDQK